VSRQGRKKASDFATIATCHMFVFEG
jgi:hypothetical protein